MIESKLRELLFEETNWLLLNKTPELSEDELFKLYSTKPGEINIILSRTVQFLKEDHPGKTKRDVIIEILEVLNRSYVARKLIGTGLKDNYKLFKGFPVRQGDEHENLPDPNNEINLKPKDNFLSWTSDATEARASGATWDSTKGDPIGGLLVELNIDSSKILFDVNAVTNFVKLNLDSLNKYNTRAAPGMAISKNNIEYFSKESQYYTGDYEVIVPSSINVVNVADKWVKTEQDTVDWKMSDKEVIQEPTVNNDNEVEDDEKHSPIEETLKLFESYSSNDIVSLEESVIDFFHKVAGTVRGDTLKYLQSLQKQYKTQIDIYEAAKKFAKMVDVDKGERRAKIADDKIRELNTLLHKTSTLLEKVKDNNKLTLDFTGDEE